MVSYLVALFSPTSARLLLIYFGLVLVITLNEWIGNAQYYPGIRLGNISHWHQAVL